LKQGRQRCANSAKKPGPDTNLTWPSIIKEDQSGKLKKGMRPGGHTILHMQRFKSWLKSSKLFLIPMKNKNTFEKTSDQRPYGYRVERLIQNNPPRLIHRGKTTKANEDLLLTG
jgi:hypothetical protein